jgi:hypothetical protein
MTDTGEPQVIELGGDVDGLLDIRIPPASPLGPPPEELRAQTQVDQPSVNFGPGVELLMNEKRKGDMSPRATASESELADVGGLDAQLDRIGSSKTISKSGLFNKALMTAGGMGGSGVEGAAAGEAAGAAAEMTSGGASGGGLPTNSPIGPGPDTPQIAKATASAAGEADASKDRTWDGFAPFGSVPVDPDNAPAPPPMSQEETLRQKFKVLRELEAIEKKGVSVSKRYSMESSLQEMQGEYETIVAEREKKASAKFQGRMLMAAVTGLEFLNNRFDPFDVRLDGWAEQVGENLEDYDEIFGELHNKYKSKAKMAPELKLMFQLAGSAIMVHMTNSMFKSSVPGMDDIMRQNPELMQQFSQAAASSMSASSPGLASFMQDFGGGRGGRGGGAVGGGGPNARPPPPPNVAHGPPPAPVRTQAPRSAAPPPRSRPDIAAARGGVDIEDNHATTDEAARPEMRGPTDISSILSGLKTRSIDVPQRGTEPPEQSSTISVQELKELSASRAPPRSKRRGTSERNIVSLEL